MEVKTKVRKWGNSLAIILPKGVVEGGRFKENDELVVDIKKQHLAREFFGAVPSWKKPTQSIKDEMKKGW